MGETSICNGATIGWRRRRVAFWRAELRVFLTGGTGFLGSYIVAELVRRGHQVTCMIRRDSADWRLAEVRSVVQFVYGELFDPASLHDIVVRAKPEAVCHAAWSGVINLARNDPAQDRNVAAAATLARAAGEAGARTLVAFGSQAEYGPLNRIAREDDPLEPTTLYGRAKCAARDEIARQAEKAEIRFAWLRVFSLYGPRDHVGWVLPSVICALLRGESPALTAGEQLWDFAYAGDAAQAAADILETDKAAGNFNLGSGEAPPLRKTIEMIRDLIAPQIALGFGQVPYRLDQVMQLQADITRLKKHTGWQPKTSLEEGLSKTVAWFRAHPTGGQVECKRI